MTLDSDRPKKNLRKPMSRVGIIVTISISIAVAVLAFAIVMTVTSGQSFF